MKHIRQQRLVGKIVRHRGGGGEPRDDLVVNGPRGVDDLEAAVGHPQAGCWGCAGVLGGLRGRVLSCVGAVLGNPLFWFKVIARKRVS